MEPLTLVGALRLYRAYCAERDRMLAWLAHNRTNQTLRRFLG